MTSNFAPRFLRAMWDSAGKVFAEYYFAHHDIYEPTITSPLDLGALQDGTRAGPHPPLPALPGAHPLTQYIPSTTIQTFAQKVFGAAASTAFPSPATNTPGPGLTSWRDGWDLNTLLTLAALLAVTGDWASKVFTPAPRIHIDAQELKDFIKEFKALEQSVKVLEQGADKRARTPRSMVDAEKKMAELIKAVNSLETRGEAVVEQFVEQFNGLETRVQTAKRGGKDANECARSKADSKKVEGLTMQVEALTKRAEAAEKNVADLREELAGSKVDADTVNQLSDTVNSLKAEIDAAKTREEVANELATRKLDKDDVCKLVKSIIGEKDDELNNKFEETAEKMATLEQTVATAQNTAAEAIKHAESLQKAVEELQKENASLKQEVITAKNDITEFQKVDVITLTNIDDTIATRLEDPKTAIWKFFDTKLANKFQTEVESHVSDEGSELYRFIVAVIKELSTSVKTEVASPSSKGEEAANVPLPDYPDSPLPASLPEQGEPLPSAPLSEPLPSKSIIAVAAPAAPSNNVSSPAEEAKAATSDSNSNSSDPAPPFKSPEQPGSTQLSPSPAQNSPNPSNQTRQPAPRTSRTTTTENKLFLKPKPKNKKPDSQQYTSTIRSSLPSHILIDEPSTPYQPPTKSNEAASSSSVVPAPALPQVRTALQSAAAASTSITGATSPLGTTTHSEQSAQPAQTTQPTSHSTDVTAEVAPTQSTSTEPSTSNLTPHTADQDTEFSEGSQSSPSTGDAVAAAVPPSLSDLTGISALTTSTGPTNAASLSTSSQETDAKRASTAVAPHLESTSLPASGAITSPPSEALAHNPAATPAPKESEGTTTHGSSSTATLTVAETAATPTAASTINGSPIPGYSIVQGGVRAHSVSSQSSASTSHQSSALGDISRPPPNAPTEPAAMRGQGPPPDGLRYWPPTGPKSTQGQGRGGASSLTRGGGGTSGHGRNGFSQFGGGYGATFNGGHVGNSFSDRGSANLFTGNNDGFTWAPQVGSSQVGSWQVGPSQIGLMQVGSTQAGSSKSEGLETSRWARGGNNNRRASGIASTATGDAKGSTSGPPSNQQSQMSSQQNEPTSQPTSAAGDQPPGTKQKSGHRRKKKRPRGTKGRTRLRSPTSGKKLSWQEVDRRKAAGLWPEDDTASGGVDDQDAEDLEEESEDGNSHGAEDAVQPGNDTGIAPSVGERGGDAEEGELRQGL